jgi:propionate CoA-transferase
VRRVLTGLTSCTERAPKVCRPEEAAILLRDGATVVVCGDAGALVPDRVLAAIEERFLREGHPRDLTLVLPVAVGDVADQPGADRLAHPGLVRRVIAGSYVTGTSPRTGRRSRLTELVLADEVEAYNWPIGTLMHLLEAIGAGWPGILTPVGLHTFVDPRLGGGRLNSRTKDVLNRIVEVDGREYLLYPSFRVDVAIVRASTADPDGYLSCEREGLVGGIYVEALAARSSGGTVIAQVARLAERGSLPPLGVRVPGPLVDAVVLAPDQAQATGLSYDPGVAGEFRVPLPPEPEPQDAARRVIARRALRDLRPGEVVILGVGIPAEIPTCARAEGSLEDFTFLTEHGIYGGKPLTGAQFGPSRNPRAIIDTPSQFAFIDGGNCDAAALAFAELDAGGNVNVSKLPALIPGCGGFINIARAAKRLVFCGTFTAGGLAVEAEGGRLRILREGTTRKFVERVAQVTFPLGRLLGGREARVVTERAVFQFTGEGLLLEELAPGVDLERDVLRLMEFRPRIANGGYPPPMAPELFTEPRGLALRETERAGHAPVHDGGEGG